MLSLEVGCRPASKLGGRYVVGVGQCRAGLPDSQTVILVLSLSNSRIFIEILVSLKNKAH